jgi:hypothetical protein
MNYTPPALTIKINNDREDGELKMIFEAGQSAFGPYINKAGITSKYYETELVKIREKMTQWSKAYAGYLEKDDNQLTCNPERIKEVWKELAQWGRDRYRELFDLEGRNSQDLIQWSEDLKLLKGKRIVVDSAIGNIPWGLLYDAEVPESLEGDYVKELLEHFWVTSYQLEVLPNYPRSRFLWEPSLKNEKNTRLTVTINKDIKGSYGVAQDTFFGGLAGRLGAVAKSAPSTLVVNYDKTELIKSITNREEPQHLIYFYCHHKKAGGDWTLRGYRNFDETKMIIRGEDPKNAEATLSIKEMRRNEHIKEFSSPPVVFFNACESSQTEIGDPSSFMQYFVNILRSYAFIGTEAEIPAGFADEFGRRFVSEFLNARSIGEIMFAARKDFALNHHNPFGLYYTLFGDGNVRLEQAVKET